MPKTRLTKNELKKQKDALKSFRRYLPTLMLKKQQLQMEIMKIHHAIQAVEEKKATLREYVEKWVDVFAEDLHLAELVGVKDVVVSEGNIAGIDIPVFKDVELHEASYDLMRTPLWVDYGIDALKRKARLNAEHRVLEMQLELVREELRITTQRVNLFEKIKIPQAVENIRKIRIFLGDIQTAAVVTGKIAKQKIEAKNQRASSGERAAT